MMPFLPLYVGYPSWLHPQIFPVDGPLSLLRWYGLMYVVAFATAFLALKDELREGALDTRQHKASEDDLFGVMTYGIIALIIGARVFATLVYDTSGIYRRAPWLMFWPFDTETGRFTGLAGMSYHGGFIGGWLGVVLWCAVHKRKVLLWMDALAAAIPAGYTFGRLGNFLNGELYGRVTAMPWGMVFPSAEKFSLSFEWVRSFAAKCGMQVASEGMVNLPRHPSQLYEAIFEGAVLFLILRFVRHHKKWDGQVAGCYVMGYGLVRFVIEYFREPDSDLGYRIAFDSSAPIYTNTSLLNFSTGQVLCFGMVLIGAAILLLSWLKRTR